MNSKLSGFIFFFYSILILCACNRVGNNTQVTSCDSVILDNFRAGADTLKSNPPRLLNYAMDYYKGTAPDCHNIISELVCNKVFNAIYSQPDLGSAGVPFLDSMGHEEALSVSHRALAALKISCYYLYGLNEPKNALPSLMYVKEREAELNNEASKVFNATMSQYYYQRADYKEACTYFLNSLRIAEKDKDSVAIAANSINFAAVYSKMGNYREGLKLANKALDIFSAQQYAMGISYCEQEIGALYGKLKMYDSSDRAYQRVLTIIDSSAPDPGLAFTTYLNLAANAIERDSVRQAIAYFDKAKNLLDVLKDESHQQLYVIASAPAYASIRPVDKEIAQIKNYITELYKQNDLATVQSAYQSLFSIYDRIGSSKLALENYIRYDSVKQVLASKANREYISEMNTRLRSEQKQLQIQVQKKDIKRSKFQIAFVSSLILILIMIVTFILTRRKLKHDREAARRRRQFTQRLLLNIEGERNRIAHYLQERVGDKLLSLKYRMAMEPHKVQVSVDTILGDLDDISRDLHPMLLKNEGLEAGIRYICSEMGRNNKVNITFYSGYRASLGRSAELQIFRMIQEALNNIVKYANATSAKVILNENDESVIVKIKDNGGGFNVDKAYSSSSAFGIINIRERSSALNGDARIASSDAGTVIHIEIPKPSSD